MVQRASARSNFNVLLYLYVQETLIKALHLDASLLRSGRPRFCLPKKLPVHTLSSKDWKRIKLGNQAEIGEM